MANDSEDDIPLSHLQNELEVGESGKHGIKRSRSPSPRLQAELPKRSKMPPASFYWMRLEEVTGSLPIC